MTHETNPMRKPGAASDDTKIDEAMEDTFPASDPPANTGIVGPVSDEPADGARTGQ